MSYDKIRFKYRTIYRIERCWWDKAMYRIVNLSTGHSTTRRTLVTVVEYIESRIRTPKGNRKCI